jgi:preprotein translocase subunit SecA
MLVNLRQQLTSVLSHVELRMEPPPPPPPAFGEYSFGEPRAAEREPAMAEMEAIGAGAPFASEPPAARGRPARRGNGYAGNGSGERPAGPRAPWAGTPRNAACPCGSGKKFKHCHGRI